MTLKLKLPLVVISVVVCLTCGLDQCSIQWKPLDIDEMEDGATDFSTQVFAANSDNVTAQVCFKSVKTGKPFKEGALIPIQEVIKQIESPEDKDKGVEEKIFVMLNGANQGLFIDYDFTKGNTCLGTLAYIAAQGLGVEQWQLFQPMRLFTTSGVPVREWDDVVRSDYMLHLLLNEETWVWPGIEVGFKWKVNGIGLQTVALRPKVIIIYDLVDDELIDSLIDAGKDRLFRSPEKHYSNSPEFKEYRTSETATISRDHHASLKLRKMIQRIGRLPELDMVEPLQLLKYKEGKWYKPHLDLFHHPNFKYEQPDANGIPYPDSFKSWSLYWRYVMFTSAQMVQKNNVPNEILFAAADLFFSNESNPWYPLHSNEKLQNNLAVLAVEHGFVEANEVSNAPSPFNKLLAKSPGLLDQLVEPYLCAALFQNSETCNKEEVAFLASLIPVEESIEPSRIYRERNRIFTVLPYLSHVEEGGETVFPKAVGPSLFGKNNATRTGMEACSRGIYVPPLKGSAAFFYHLLPDGQRDELSMHGGCPPVRGVKYALNIFCWNLNWEKGFTQFQ